MFVQYIRMLCTGRFILVESVFALEMMTFFRLLCHSFDFGLYLKENEKINLSDARAFHKAFQVYEL